MSSELPYHEQAKRFFQQYQSLSFDDVHQDWLSYLPPRPGLALDVGAGSGRDAKALAERGWQVMAVEPAAAMRGLGRDHTQGCDITWLDDRLPGLSQVRTLSQRYQLIMVSAVWMHLRPEEQKRALRVLASLLAPGGVLVITFRQGDAGDDRQFFEVSQAALDRWAHDLALLPVASTSSDDRLKREGIVWQLSVFRLPDDGTGALPVLRHVIVNDDKSSTYKLGLLRTLVRLADTAPGIVLERDEDFVTLPLGAVGLYWLFLYRPLLLDYQLRQSPGSRNYGFAKEDFYRLASLAPGDMRLGSPLSDPATAATVLRAIRTACQTVVKMPAHYTTWPGSNRPIFEGNITSFRISERAVRLDRDMLASFGTFRIPAHIWDCMSRYACWLEPAITNEWVLLMQGYNTQMETGRLYQALRWPESRRETLQVRQLVAQQLEDPKPLPCVWSRQDLHRSVYAIDHCFPWARWQNNDLWNLLPVTERANSAKSDRLPAAALMERSREDILSWWNIIIGQFELATQFHDEAQASLPLVQSLSLDGLFDSVMIQRQRLRANQQLVEWYGL
ncbi:methyltransferase domain-containing protein [Billgrantia diversa]|uniref:class I SAM-dependent methyltransferase n=1 Tax=Halomonas sp. MCCC 1A13316 TaxID=2733487 RepID=UPI0018A34D2B|nr:class I SAM-dependent methyltransferase [Halomonas sp. MCCC 1A13316]QOR37630.1 methyltransferase domain-containing protein [Halomonas sp. MCCC 1A13316]